MNIEIKKGGQVEKLTGKLKSININSMEDGYMYELWLTSTTGEDSLSYISLTELLQIRDSINDTLRATVIKK